MTIVLNHTIVAAADRHAAARFFADLLGLSVGPPTGPFVPVRVNDDLTLDFDDRTAVAPGHYAFLVDDDTFDAVMDRLTRRPDIEFGAGVGHGWDRAVRQLVGGRGVYVLAPDGHSYELFTVAP